MQAHTATVNYIEYRAATVPHETSRSLVYQANMFESQFDNIVHRSVKVEFKSREPQTSLRNLYPLLPSIFPEGAQFQIQFENKVITPQ